MVIEKQPKNMSKLWIIVFFSCRFHWLKRVIPQGRREVQKLLEQEEKEKGDYFQEKEEKAVERI